MPPRGFTNPAPKTDSARSALSSFHCALCSKSYSRHPEYEAHISSYDHQHKKRLRDLKQLSRDPNAAERARKAERKADAEAGLVVVDSAAAKSGGTSNGGGGDSGGGGGSGGGFKKGGFKSSFAVVAGGGAGGNSVGTSTGPAGLRKRNVLGDDEDDESDRNADAKNEPLSAPQMKQQNQGESSNVSEYVESDTDEEYGGDNISAGGGYYDPRRPTDCFSGCGGAKAFAVA